MNLTWLGQGGFLFESEGTRLTLDPYLSDSADSARMAPPPVRPEDLEVDGIVCTHDHIDHFDPATVRPMLGRRPSCLLCGPASVVKHAREVGIDAARCRTLRAGVLAEVGTFRLVPVPAYHTDQAAIGLVLHCEDLNCYISGDSLYRNDLAEKVRCAANGAPELVIICINGKWGNMSLNQALTVVHSLTPAMAIPMHYGLFAENTVDPEPFVQQCLAAGIQSAALQVGKPVAVSNAAFEEVAR